jgi:hypothetical protein
VSAQFELTVHYDDGATVDVKAGQRECAAWEREPFGCATMQAVDRTPVLFVRYLAFAALKRLRQLPPNADGRAPTFEQWDAGVDDVEDAGADDEDDDDEAGPTTPDRPVEA